MMHDLWTSREPRDPAAVLPYALDGLAAFVQDTLEQLARARHTDEVHRAQVHQDLPVRQDERTSARGS